MILICWCGHADKYHSTTTPNECTKCEERQYLDQEEIIHHTATNQSMQNLMEYVEYVN